MARIESVVVNGVLDLESATTRRPGAGRSSAGPPDMALTRSTYCLAIS
jgi:hypothetical protein